MTLVNHLFNDLVDLRMVSDALGALQVNAHNQIS